MLLSGKCEMFDISVNIRSECLAWLPGFTTSNTDTGAPYNKLSTDTDFLRDDSCIVKADKCDRKMDPSCFSWRLEGFLLVKEMR